MLKIGSDTFTFSSQKDNSLTEGYIKTTQGLVFLGPLEQKFFIKRELKEGKRIEIRHRSEAAEKERTGRK